MRRLVITGVGGFVGIHLARIAAEAGWSVHGIGRADRPEPAAAAALDGYVAADLRREWPRATPTDADIVHLAGRAAVGPSFAHPQDYLAGNSAMVTAMGEAMLRADTGRRIVGVSTGAVYAGGGDSRDEGAPVGFSSPYALSKVLVENQLAYYRGRGLDTVVARPFNHFGPGQQQGFLVPDLARQLLTLPADAPLPVGNLDTRRDYSDVRDVARAYLALVDAPALAHELYNVASGAARSGREVLAAVCAALGRDVPALHVDPGRIRPADPASIRGDASRLRTETGWRPAIPFEQSIQDAVAVGDRGV